MRVNVYIPDELAERVRAELPDLNLSKLVQSALSSARGCIHERVTCELCGALIGKAELSAQILEDFYREAMNRLEDLVRKCGTAEGAARILRDVALGHDVGRFRPLPRPTREQRQMALDLKWRSSA
jgi:hypothetical protein